MAMSWISASTFDLCRTSPAPGRASSRLLVSSGPIWVNPTSRREEGWRHALDRGVTRKVVRRGLDRGEWVRYRGVFRLAGCPDDTRARAWAALFTVGQDCLLTGLTALDLYGLDLATSKFSDDNDAPYIHILVPMNRHVEIRGVVAIRDKRSPVGVYRVDRLPCVSRDRAAVDAIRILPLSDARNVAYRALQQGWLRPKDLDRWIERLKGCRGITQLRKVSADISSGARAESERELVALLRSAGISGWRANSAIRGRSGATAVGDVVFGEARLVIEVDGRAWHTDRERFQRDRTRQNDLVNDG